MRRLVSAISLWALMLAQAAPAPCAALASSPIADGDTPAGAHHAASAATQHHHAESDSPPAGEDLSVPAPASHGEPCVMAVQCQWLAIPQAAPHVNAAIPADRLAAATAGQLPATVDASATTPPPRPLS